ncbi:AraC family transcriptional regulator [Methylobacterium durans]|uniref:AraC family transcriptional regulator n=2 Tax=Methylobacterium durans TaxID=2202825 RepID=A0A2U8W3T2_9HYPH|nr:AraC family transcriptional regulator [Methylobacterium durans]
MLLRPSSGIMVVQQQDQRAVVTTREAILLTLSESPTIRLMGVERLDWFELADDDLSASMVGAAASLRVFSEDNAALALLGSYGAALMRGLLPVTTPSLRDHAIRHMAGLVDIMCSDAALPSKGPGTSRQAGRIRAIKAEIEVRLGERNLSARHFAQLSGMSVRSLQKLFEADGQTFSEFVLERRLERALRLLRSTAKGPQSISAIAFEVGFGDLSYFNRTFRKRYGMPPRRVRSAHASLAADFESADPETLPPDEA